MNRIKEFRLKKNMTQDDIGRALNVSKSTVSKYENETVALSQKVIDILCNLFDITSDTLLGRCDMQGFAQIDSISEVPENFTGVPLLGRVHAGMPMFAQENIEEYIPHNTSDVSDGDYFYMEVEGDCMTGDCIPEGALVLVRQQHNVHNNDIAVVRVEDEVVLRHVSYVNGQIVLIPSNPAYEPMIITGGNVEIVGKVCEVRFTM